MKTKQSVYSKMYLVTPNVYDKVLQNIDEKLQKSTSELNIEKQTEERPSGKILEDISTQEVQAEQLDNPVAPEIIDNPDPELIDPEPIQVQEAEPTFGQSEIMEPGQIEPEVVSEPQTESNPLTTSCAQPQVQDQFIPLIRKQGVKKKRVTLGGKIRKPLIVPSIIKQIPQIQRVQQESNFDPNIKRVKVTRPEPTAMIRDVPKKPRKFVCNVCLKGFQTSYHLNRHIATVHKNISDVQTAQALPDDDIQMGGPSIIDEGPMERPVFPKPSTSKQFQSWKESQEKTLLPSKGKRKPADAKLKYTPRPNKTRVYETWE